ncbi:hypothetical protein QMK33_00600 [Hymenobacter sp. H14-R3]|uniref:hypothetical protein n=1 Tax=Hymenobacter sp. H14-R3 TaxID=3046308 RepID=UPI0024BA1789|nr:hypothetical protein [Hymenobacter sp. H14-R3]MDJ0363634.1 hypothetical protein [Hymenobacter sp. H14-R3]
MALSRLLRIWWGGVLITSSLGALAQTAPPTDSLLLAAHRTVAVLPFEATVQLVQMRDLIYGSSTATSVANRQQQPVPPDAAQQQKQMEVAYQMQAYTLMQLQEKIPRHGYRVQWQPVEETNRRLDAAGITYAELARQPLSRLQQVLGVDALLTGQVMLYQPIPKSMALALRMMSNEPLLYGPSTVPPSQTEASLALYDCASNRQVWQFDFGRTGANALGPARLAPRLVKAALPSLPYCQRVK